MKIHFYLAVLAMASLCVSCADERKGEKPAGSYPTLTIGLRDQVLRSDFAASVTGCQTVEVRPQIDGMLTRICIREGDAVRKGQVLFEIDPAQFQAACDIARANVQSAEAGVSTARLVLESNKELYAEKVISDFELSTARNELAEAVARLNLAKAELQKAATNLSYTRVKSPVDGVASMIPYRVGALVGTNIAEPLVTVSDDGQIYAYFSMTENQMLDLVQQYGSMEKALAGMPEVEFRMSNGHMYPRKGRIDAVSGTISRSTGAVSFRAVFPNPDKLLRNGATGTVVIPALHRRCVVIPQGATYELQDRVFVYKVVDGKAASAEIKVLPQSNGKEYIVTEGLVPGDVIVADGAGLLREGTEIQPKTRRK